MNNLKIVIAGGSGFIGQEMAAWFGKNNQVVILTRNTKEANNSYGNTSANSLAIKTVLWDGRQLGDWVQELEGADLLINLAGKSVNCRYTAKNKQAIFDSRTQSTHILGEAMRKVANPPSLWINAASATIYRHAEDRPQDEYTGEYHNDFSVQVCQLWEKSFFAEKTPQTRKIALRIAITLGNGGVIVPFLTLAKLGLGGHQGNGRQMFSWVHAADLCRTVEWCYTHTNMKGVYNCSAPQPVTNSGFMKTLRQATGHHFGLPAPAWMLKIGAVLIGTEAELLLKSRWVLPTKLQETGFRFQYPALPEAMQEIVEKLPRKTYHLF